MKKALFLVMVAFLAVVMVYGFPAKADAAITGVCVNCHTMHNSQGGAAVYAGGPYPLLLFNTCIGCHSSSTTSTIVSNTPIVYNTGGYPASARGAGTATTPLAGGNFYGNGTADTTIHNAIGTAGLGVDGVLGNIPPGGSTLGTQLSCAGTAGCHGEPAVSNSDAAIKGSHHTNTTGTLDGTTVGKSFRFLKGVTGVEDSNWEQSASSTDHNGYKGATDVNGTAADISFSCGSCHGNGLAGGFHGTAGVSTATPWLRHPTDIVLTSTTATGYGVTYNLETPVALATPSTSVSAVGVTSRVICLTCHNAHGSPYADLMRFDYTMNAGGGGTTGCLRCHINQR